jgi:hypothetical protein
VFQRRAAFTCPARQRPLTDEVRLSAMEARKNAMSNMYGFALPPGFIEAMKSAHEVNTRDVE